MRAPKGPCELKIVSFFLAFPFSRQQSLPSVQPFELGHGNALLPFQRRFQLLLAPGIRAKNGP
jgi:hypothetical protein